jgi:hypothetical protein
MIRGSANDAAADPQLWLQFDTLDRDGDGVLSVEEFSRYGVIDEPTP